MYFGVDGADQNNQTANSEALGKALVEDLVITISFLAIPVLSRHLYTINDLTFAS
jgi:hypothetical protein